MLMLRAERSGYIFTVRKARIETYIRYFLVESTRHIQFCSAAIVLDRIDLGLPTKLCINTSVALPHYGYNISESRQIAFIHWRR